MKTIMSANAETNRFEKGYTSVREAATDAGTSPSNIYNVLNGKQQTAAGKRWYRRN